MNAFKDEEEFRDQTAADEFNLRQEEVERNEKRLKEFRKIQHQLEKEQQRLAVSLSSRSSQSILT